MIQYNSLHWMLNWRSSTSILSWISSDCFSIFLNDCSWGRIILIYYLLMACILWKHCFCGICIQTRPTFIKIWCQRYSLSNHTLFHCFIRMLVSIGIFWNSSKRRVLVLCHLFWTSYSWIIVLNCLSKSAINFYWFESLRYNLLGTDLMTASCKWIIYICWHLI